MANGRVLHTQKARQALWGLYDFFEAEGREKQNEQTKSELRLQRSCPKPQRRRDAGRIAPAQDHLARTNRKGANAVQVLVKSELVETEALLWDVPMQRLWWVHHLG